MNGFNKGEEIKRDLCKNHSARSEREPFRVCPSKLSKKELEDLYFSVLENNVELKRTVNSQQEKIKALSTKVQRMTVTQKIAPGRENECCTNIRAMVNEQKQSIADLKKANERMSEKIRVLNMRLCSAKQFLRRSPGTSMPRCTKCSAPPTSLKNSSVSILNGKSSDINAKSEGVSSQYLDKDVRLSTRSVETETEEQEKEHPEKVCDQNKWRSLIEELKQKIVDLQEELTKCHEEYSSRITRLEQEVINLRVDNERSQVQHASSAQQLQLRADQADQLAVRLRAAEAHYGELAMELSVEKRKVAELETRVRAADMSCAVARTIEDHLSNANQIKIEIEKENQQLDASGSPYFSPRDKSSSRLEAPGETRGLPSVATEQGDDHKVSKLSDDSGFVPDSPTADHNHKGLTEEIRDRISVLQQQLDMLKLSTGRAEGGGWAAPAPCSPRAPPAPAVGAPAAPVPDSLSKIAFESVPTLNSENYVKTELRNSVEHKDHNSLQGPDEDTKPAHCVSVHTDLGRSLEGMHTSSAKFQEAAKAFFKVQVAQSSLCNSNLEQEKDDDDEVIKEVPSIAKSDAHNSMQIPGPMPVGDTTTEPKPERTRRRYRKDNSRKRFRTKKDSTDSTMSHVKEVVSLDMDVMDLDDDMKLLKENMAVSQKNLIMGESSMHVPRADKEGPGSSKMAKISNEEKEDDRLPSDDNGKDDELLIKVAGPSLIEKFMDDEVSYCVPTGERGVDPPDPADAAGGNDEEDARPSADDGGPIELCARFARVCTCRSARRREVSVFRTCSGTLRFRTTSPPPPAPLALCACLPGAAPAPPALHLAPCHKDTQTDKPPPPSQRAPQNKSATYSKDTPAQTYSVPPRSPDNTDCEISTLTDLPSEKDGKSPRALSPGEEKPTSTFTESYSAPTTEYGTLSEGELPGAGSGRKLSVGEAKVNFQDASRLNATPASHRMEEALAAISEELALCRDLLQARHAPTAKTSKDASLMVDLCPGPIALKRAAASPRIGDAFTPKCIFTLHIGTVVLSDEAVINSRNKSLVLNWKFYDQNVTMTRMKTGRVVLFDFSTEYDVKITDQFLNYMKHDEMQLQICELDNQWEPFASCALRLRDALLHTNRRADMSLALTAGPQLRQARAARDALDSSDEVGVLDLWCMLRVDPALLPAINRAIAKGSSSAGRAGGAGSRRSTASGAGGAGGRRASRGSRASAHGRYLAQVTEEDHSADDRLSQDLDMRLKTHAPMYPAYDVDSRPVPDSNSIGSQTRGGPPTSVLSANDLDMDRPAAVASSIALQTRRPSDAAGPAGKYSDTGHPTVEEKYLDLDQEYATAALGSGPRDTDDISSDTRQLRSNPSKIIVNEVTTKIRSAYEMKQALDDATSQTHSTGGSWRGLVTRRLIPKTKRRSSNNNLRVEEPKGTSFPSFFKYYNKENSARMSKCSKGYPAPVIRSSSDIPEPTELTRAHRSDNTSKKSVTYTDWGKENTVYYDRDPSEEQVSQNIDITIMWLALNDECDAMMNPAVQRLYVAYTFLGRNGAGLETPVSLPKPASYVDKCFFQFTKTFQLNDCDLPLLGHMAKCRSSNKPNRDPRDCIIFTVISEPPEDPLGLDSCEDIGYAYLYLGDLLEYSAGSDSYTEVVPVLSSQEGESVCGVLAVKVDGLDVMRRCEVLAAPTRSQLDVMRDA